MKKMIAVTAVSLMAGIASADFAITWLSNQGPVWQDGGSIAGPYATDGNMVQLIWTADMPDFSVSKAQIGGGVAAGEFLLQATVTSGGYGFFQSAAGTAVYDNSLVGGADINSGYVFSRIFDSSAPAMGEYYLDTGLIDTSSWVYNDTQPDTIYGANIVGATGVGISDELTTVQVPEPATIGMMGIAGVGMFLARKKNRR